MYKEAFETEHSVCHHFFQLCMITGNDTAPECAIDIEQTVNGIEFLFERVQGGGDGNAVERHINNGGDAAGGRGPCGGNEAFPFGSPGLIDMDMAIDQSGNHDQITCVLDSNA